MQKIECETCHNIYEKTFKVIMNNQEHYFDSFECAISALAPHCAHCNTRIIGHGVEKKDYIFCCSSCARHFAQDSMKDRPI